MDVDRKPILVKIRIGARFAFFILSKSLHELNELCFKIFSFCATMLNVCKIKKREAPFFRVQRLFPDQLNCAQDEVEKSSLEKSIFL